MDLLSRLWLDCLAGNFTENTIAQLARVSTFEATRLIALSKKQGLTALFYWRVRPFANRLPSTLIEPLRQQYLFETARSVQREKELARVLSALNTAKVQTVVFKGAALAHTVYPLPELRTTGDFDLWIDLKQMDDAIYSLEQIGYVWREKKSRPHTWQLEREGEIQLFGTGPRHGLVELHYGVFAGEWLYRTACVNSATVRARCQPATIVGQSAWTLAPEDALIQIAVHIAISHSMSATVLRSLMDILFLSSHIGDWEQVVSRVHKWRVATPVGLVLQFADDLLRIPVLYPTLTRLKPGAFRRRLIGSFIDHDSIISAKDLTRTKSRFLFLLLLVHRPIDMLRLIYRAFIPERAWLERRYGMFTWNVRLRHFVNALGGHF
jgi:hypothetical protein